MLFFHKKFHFVFFMTSWKEGEGSIEYANINKEKNTDKYIKQLEHAKLTEERVKLFSTWMDSYWLDGIIWAILPWLWDWASCVISSLYLLYEWSNLWFSTWECLKILWYQIADFTIWSVPLFWDIVDFFFTWNKFSAKVFSKHLKNLEKEAIKNWVTKNEIDRINKRWSIFQQLIGSK